MTTDISRCGNCGTELAASEAEGLCPRCLMQLAIVGAGGRIDSPAAVISSGDRLGPYEIVSLISRGGMGEVYRASDTRLDRSVAIKLLPAHVADSPARRHRFEREARLVSTLSHPHICPIFDVGEHHGAPYLVMEYLEGETLAARLVRGPLPIDLLSRYAIEIGDALDHAHRLGVIHRDLKPANIMLTSTGAKLLDFGIAKLSAPDASGGKSTADAGAILTLTEAGTLLGTPSYMAPEQLAGGEVDARTDLFAFGLILYEMATGRPAFQGSTQAAIFAAILERQPEPLRSARPDTPPPLDQIVTRCLSKEPAERWQTAHDLREALNWIAVSPLQAVALAGAWPLAHQRRHRGRLAAGGVTLVAVLAAIGLVIALSRRAPADTQPVRFIVTPPEHANFSESSAFLAVSPDGHSLAFIASSPGGSNALWIRSLDSLEARQLPGTDGAAQPFWSPDNRSVAFPTLGVNAVRRIDVLSGLLRTIEESWAATGTWNREGVILLPGGVTRDGPIMRIPAAGGLPVAVTSLDTTRGETSHTWPHFLPDGRHFLYLTRSTRPEHDGVLYVGSLDSTERIRVAHPASHAVYAPQGYLVYMQGNTLVAQAFDARTFRVTGEPLPVAHQVERTVGSRRGAFSISGTGVLAYRPIAETRLTWYERSGRPLQSIGPEARYTNPDLSPDEKQVAVGRLDVATGAPDIWLIDLTRADLASRFTFDSAADDMPLWSADGRRIVYRTAFGGLRQKALDGSAPEELMTDVGPTIPNPLDWSPDGCCLLHQARPRTGVGSDLWLLPLQGNRPATPVFQTPFLEAQGHFSPDGRWLAYISNESGRNEVYVRAFPSGNSKRQVSSQGGIEPMWRRDGKELFYLALDRKLMAVAVSTGSAFEAAPPVTLFETRMSVLLTAAYSRNQYVVSADGQRFLINQPRADAPSSPITVVVNWPATLKP